MMASTAIDREETLIRLHRAEAEIFALGVQKLALFGSMQRDAAKKESDVDLLVEFKPSKKDFENFMALADFLEDILGRHVDLVTTESLSPYIGPHILSKAVIVLRAA